MKDTLDLQSSLDQFYGTENYYINPLYRWMRYTDGVKFFAENAGAYWLLDIFGTELRSQAQTEEFISITMEVKDGKADIIADDGNDNFLWSRRDIHTDCPAGTWRFYLSNNVLMLASEY